MRKIILLFAVMLIGCATTEGYKKVLNPWKGQHIDELVNKWGAPQGYHKYKDGYIIVEYTRSNYVDFSLNKIQPVYGNFSGVSESYTYTTENTTMNMWCRTRFYATPEGIIYRWEFNGNNCVSLPPSDNIHTDKNFYPP